VICLKRALIAKPDHAGALNNLGLALGKWREAGDPAMANFRRALAIQPADAVTLNNIGLLFNRQGDTDLALQVIRRAAAFVPDLAEVFTDCGNILKEQGHPMSALTLHERAIRLEPQRPIFHQNRAFALFCAGQLPEAWQEFEWRDLPSRPYTMPIWDGSPIPDQELLIWGEQGIGDQILGVGMLGDALKRVGSCIVECDPRLVDLFGRSFPSVTFVGTGSTPVANALGAAYQLPMFGLARHFRNRFEDFPSHGGYLTPDPRRLVHWREWLDSLGPGLKVGVSWRGRLVAADRSRHFAPIEGLAPIFAIAGIIFVNLQYDGYLEDIGRWRQHTGYQIHIPPDIDLTNDLDDAAALTSAVDLVVTPATAVGMLAGALGKPTLMFAFFPGSNEKEICGMDHLPWAPSVRIESFMSDPRHSLEKIAEHIRHIIFDRQNDKYR